MSEKVHLFDLRLRTSAAGNDYLTGWLGKASVVAFLDREAEGTVWQVFVSTPQPRPNSNAAPSGTPSPLAPRPRPSRGRARPMAPGELDDELPDLG